MKILLPVEGSSFSTRAVRYVAKHMTSFGRRPSLTLVHVDTPMIERLSKYVSAEDLARFHEKNAAASLRAAKRLLSKAMVSFRERHLVGDAGTIIARVAKEERSDMIVMGSHGRRALKSLLPGSAVSKTLALTHLPVLIVR